MAYTPATTAFGEEGDWWVGTILGNGLRVLSRDIYWVAYNYGKVSEGDLCPFLILNTYTPDEEGFHRDDRHNAVHDGIWLANKRMLDDSRVTTAHRGIRQAVGDDLLNDSDYILCINWWQTIYPHQVVGAVEYSFPPHETAGAHGITIKGIATLSGSKIVQYLPGVNEWSALVEALPQHLLDRLPQAPRVPFFSVFQPTTPSEVLQDVGFQLALTDDIKLHCGCEAGLLCAIEYTTEDGGVAFAWLQSSIIVDGILEAFHLHDPNTLASTNELIRVQLERSYWKRDVCTGHKAMIPSLRPVDGGVRAANVVRLVYVLDFQYVPFIDWVPAANSFTMCVLEDGAGSLHRLRAPAMRQVIQTAKKLLRFSNRNAENAARAQLQRELEFACAGKQAGLRFLVFSYPCTVEYFLSLPVTASHMEWAGDDRLTLTTGNDFTVEDMGLLLRQWDVDAQRAGKRGRAAENFKPVYNRAQNDSRPNPKRSCMSYSLESCRLSIGLAVAQLNSAFKHIPESAQLPPPPSRAGGTVGYKWAPHLQTWVPRSDPDPPVSIARSAFQHAPWPWWG